MKKGIKESHFHYSLHYAALVPEHHRALYEEIGQKDWRWGYETDLPGQKPAQQEEEKDCMADKETGYLNSGTDGTTGGGISSFYQLSTSPPPHPINPY